MHRKIYKNGAEKQKAWRARQAERWLYAIKMWILPPKERPRLLKAVPWLSALSREAEELRKRLDEAERLATIGQRAEAQINKLLDRVATLEKRERRREQNRDRKRRRREGGVLLPSDPPAVRDHYAHDHAPEWPAPSPIAPGPSVGQRTAFSQPIAPSQPSAPRVAPTPPPEHWWQGVVSLPTAPTPRSAPTPDAQVLADLAVVRNAGYGSAIQGDKIRYDGKLVTPAEWRKRMGL